MLNGSGDLCVVRFLFCASKSLQKKKEILATYPNRRVNGTNGFFVVRAAGEGDGDCDERRAIDARCSSF